MSRQEITPNYQPGKDEFLLEPELPPHCCSGVETKEDEFLPEPVLSPYRCSEADSGSNSESAQIALLSEVTRGCPGGRCQNILLKEEALDILDITRRNRFYIRPAGVGYLCDVERTRESTHVAFFEHLTPQQNPELIVWPLQFTASDGMQWNYLGNGSFNIAYKSNSADNASAQVYKIPRIRPLIETLRDQSVDRCIRVWNEINHQFPAKHYEAGWTVPFFSSELRIDEPRHVEALLKWLIDLYKTNGRILVDAFVQNSLGHLLNFRTVNANDSLRVICIDTDFALGINYGIGQDIACCASVESWDLWQKYETQYVTTLSKSFGLNRKRSPNPILSLI